MSSRLTIGKASRSVRSLRTGVRNKEDWMALYLYQAAYTSESIAAQIKHPQDRLSIVGTMIANHGMRLVAGGYSMGDYDVCAVVEADSDESVAGFALALAAVGAIRLAKTTKLLDGNQWVSALTMAGAIGGSYKPAR
jgi:uncharacterized protein with GYD domain